MIQAEPAVAASRERYPGWDAAIAAVLGLALLAAGWLDAKSYLLHRDKPMPAFDFLDTQGSQRVVLDELYRSPDTFALLENIGALESNPQKRYRHAFGPASKILLTTFHPRARLNIEFFNDVPDQDITIRCNDDVLEEFPHQPKGTIIARSYLPTLRPGANTLSFGFSRYNHGPLDLGSPDPRPLVGGVFLKLDLNPE